MINAGQRSYFLLCRFSQISHIMAETMLDIRAQIRSIVMRAPQAHLDQNQQCQPKPRVLVDAFARMVEVHARKPSVPALSAEVSADETSLHA